MELIPFMKDIKSTMNYQESNLTSFNDSIHQLTTRLDQLQTKMESLNASLSEHQLKTEQLQTTIQILQNNLTHQLDDIENDVTYILGPYTCGGTGGWRRAVYLDMTDPNSTCPSGWQLTGYSKRTCGRASAGTNTCDSATFPVSGGDYSKVCGRIQGYQQGTPDAFAPYHNGLVTTINGGYADGVSLTHGSP